MMDVSGRGWRGDMAQLYFLTPTGAVRDILRTAVQYRISRDPVDPSWFLYVPHASCSERFGPQWGSDPPPPSLASSLTPSMLSPLPLLLTFVSVLTVLALPAASEPVVVRDASISLSLSRRLNLTSGHALYQRDYLRAQAFRSRALRHSDSEARRAVVSTLADNEGVRYVAQVGVGTPPTQCEFSLVCLKQRNGLSCIVGFFYL